MPRRRTAPRNDDVLARLDAIAASGDRSASEALLEHFLWPHTDFDVMTEIASVLAATEDVRVADRLLAAVLDTALPADLRGAALEAYVAIPADAPTRAESLARSRSPDAIVRSLGVRMLDAADGAMLAAAMSDPSAIVRHAAVEAAASVTRSAALVAAVRRAFADPEQPIREAACRVALFDEPFDLAGELVTALGDPSRPVRIAAAEALEDYPRVAVLLALCDAAGDGEDGLAAEMALAGVAWRLAAVSERASARARRRIERWSRPVKSLLASVPSACVSDGDGRDAGDEVAPPCVDLAEAAAVLADPDAPVTAQRRLLAARSWQGAGDAGREIARGAAASPDWSLRQAAAFALSGLGAADDLLALTADREPVVRRAAFEELLRLGDERSAGPARDTLADPVARATAGDAALACVAEFAEPSEAEAAVLAELAAPDDRDGLRLGAVHAARRRGLVRAVPHLVRIAEEPVVASVLPHVAALAAVRELGPPRRSPDLSRLESLDHLDVQCELGEWGWKGGRYA